MGDGSLPPLKNPAGRLPSFSGILMLDVVNGKVRARRWPRGKGRTQSKKQRELQERFAKAQQVANFAAPQMMADFEEATRKTPLYPRDILTSMLYGRLLSFVLEDGRKLYPMASRDDVSDALDAITQTEGDTVVRGADGWIGQQAGAGGGIEILANDQITAATTEWVSPDLTGRNFLGIYLNGLTANLGSRRTIQCRDAATGTWYTANGDYRLSDQNGSNSDTYGMVLNPIITGQAVYTGGILYGLSAGAPPACWALQRQHLYALKTNPNGIDRIRVVTMANATTYYNLTGGQIILIGG